MSSASRREDLIRTHDNHGQERLQSKKTVENQAIQKIGRFKIFLEPSDNLKRPILPPIHSHMHPPMITCIPYENPIQNDQIQMIGKSKQKKGDLGQYKGSDIKLPNVNKSKNTFERPETQHPIQGLFLEVIKSNAYIGSKLSIQNKIP